MARPTIENIRGLGDFAQTNTWDVAIQNAPGLDSDMLNLRAQSVELPKRTGASLEINIRGQKIKQPGDYDYSGTITVTLLDTDDYKLTKSVKAWREAIIETKTAKMGKKSEIEGQVTIRRLNRQGDPMETWNLKGVYLEDYELGDLSDAADLVTVTLTLSYDYFEEA